MSAVIEIKLKDDSGHEVDIFLSGGRGIKLVPGKSAEVSLADGAHVLSITQGDVFSADAPVVSGEESVQPEAEKPKRRRKKSEASESDAERGETEADAVEEPEAQEETDEDVVV